MDRMHLLRHLALPAFVVAALASASCGGGEVVVPDVYRAKFTTTEGTFTVEARKDWSPRAAERFHELMRTKHFERTYFFRVVPNFIAQFGAHRDYEVHARWRTYFILDDPRKQSNTRGTLVFAHSGPNTRAVEMFINLADNSALLDEQNFVPFARIVEGMDVADRIYSGYGDFLPDGDFVDPARVESATNSYLDGKFPEMDRILKTEIVE